MRDRLPAFADRLTLGESGLEVSPYCLGMVDDPRVVLEAFDRGVNFFFLSADMHWPLYEHTRTGLRQLLRRRGARDKVVVAAVSYVAQPEFVLSPFREVIDAVPGLKRLEVTVVGGVNGDEPERFKAFAQHRSPSPYLSVKGVRAIGASFHNRAAAAQSLARGDIDVAFVRYNSGHRGAETELFPKLPAVRRAPLFNFKSTSGYVPPRYLKSLQLAAGCWRPNVSDHYRFVLSRPEIDGILFATQTVAHLDALGRAIDKGPLDEREATYIAELSDFVAARRRARHTATQTPG